jgi:hypothetical protein
MDIHHTSGLHRCYSLGSVGYRFLCTGVRNLTHTSGLAHPDSPRASVRKSFLHIFSIWMDLIENFYQSSLLSHGLGEYLAYRARCVLCWFDSSIGTSETAHGPTVLVRNRSTADGDGCLVRISQFIVISVGLLLLLHFLWIFLSMSSAHTFVYLPSSHSFYFSATSHSRPNLYPILAHCCIFPVSIVYIQVPDDTIQECCYICPSLESAFKFITPSSTELYLPLTRSRVRYHVART